MLQAVVVAALEENLHGGVHDDEDEHIYPAAFVVLTSVLGFYIVSRLQLNGKVGPAAAWLTKCIYVAKLSVLLIPEVKSIPSSLLQMALVLVPCRVGHSGSVSHSARSGVQAAIEFVRRGWCAGPADHTSAAGDSGCHAAVPASDGPPRPCTGPQGGRAHATAPSLAGEPSVTRLQSAESLVPRQVCAYPSRSRKAASPCDSSN